MERFKTLAKKPWFKPPTINRRYQLRDKSDNIADRARSVGHCEYEIRTHYTC